MNFVVAGRLAAVAQGAPVRVFRMDLAVTEADLDAFRDGLEMTGAARWSERWHEYRDPDPDPRAPRPLRWLLSGSDELRLQVVDQLPAPVVVQVDGMGLPVWPLADLETRDDDVAEVMRRVRERSSQSAGRSQMVA